MQLKGNLALTILGHVLSEVVKPLLVHLDRGRLVLGGVDDGEGAAGNFLGIGDGVIARFLNDKVGIPLSVVVGIQGHDVLAAPFPAITLGQGVSADLQKLWIL